MVTAIVIAFCIGYLCIALESVLKVDKAVPALLMCVVCWTLFSIGYAPEQDIDTSARLIHHLGDTCEILFFLMGAMTIVEIVDANDGFFFVKDAMATTSKRSLLWRITAMAFLLSAILDNLTTSIVMVMVLSKLIEDKNDRMIYGAMIVIAANAGGAFSPIGDVTTIMLWIKGMITASGVIKEVFLPSFVAVVVCGLITQMYLKGTLPKAAHNPHSFLSREDSDHLLMLFLGVGGLVFVPIFKMLTGLPPFMGILLALGLIWLVSEYRCNHNSKYCPEGKLKVTAIMRRIDLSTIMFFLGILMSVASLQETGVLNSFGIWLNNVSDGNHYLVTGVIGVVSSIVDNVPLVAGCMDMYSIAAAGDFGVDGMFWQLLAYCAGVGGSMLIIGSAAGVVVMGFEKISFGWYMRKFSWIALLGYVAGIATYYLETLLIP